MKFLPLFFLLITSNASFASGGGGGSSPFIPLNPPIIVNLRDGSHIRHMQVIIEIKLTDPSKAAKLDLHKGPVRHELILVLSSQDAAAIEALYFTNFIIQ